MWLESNSIETGGPESWECSLKRGVETKLSSVQVRPWQALPYETIRYGRSKPRCHIHYRSRFTFRDLLKQSNCAEKHRTTWQPDIWLPKTITIDLPDVFSVETLSPKKTLAAGPVPSPATDPPLSFHPLSGPTNILSPMRSWMKPRNLVATSRASTQAMMVNDG